jgi:hypothetical protein
MNFGRRHLFIGKPTHWPTNERAEYAGQNRDTMVPGITVNKSTWSAVLLFPPELFLSELEYLCKKELGVIQILVGHE